MDSLIELLENEKISSAQTHLMILHAVVKYTECAQDYPISDRVQKLCDHILSRFCQEEKEQRKQIVLRDKLLALEVNNDPLFCPVLYYSKILFQSGNMAVDRKNDEDSDSEETEEEIFHDDGWAPF